MIINLFLYDNKLVVAHHINFKDLRNILLVIKKKKRKYFTWSNLIFFKIKILKNETKIKKLWNLIVMFIVIYVYKR